MDSTGRSDQGNYCVVLDTNIWRSELLLRTPLGAALLFAVHQSKAQIGLPEVVEKEVFRQIVKLGGEASESIKKHLRIIEVLIGFRPDYTPPDESKFTEAVKNRLDEIKHIVNRVPLTLDHARLAMEMVIAGLPPSSNNNEEFRDSLVWQAVIELSKTQFVHFVTSDKGFFRERDVKLGLAINIREDIRANNNNIYVHADLRSCVSTLQKNVSGPNKNIIAREISTLLATELEKSVQAEECKLEGLEEHEVKFYLTESSNLLAVDFALTYNLESVAIDEDANRTECRLRVSGSGFYNVGTNSISDVRIGIEEFSWLDENKEYHKGSKVYATGGAVLGTRIISFSLREPLNLGD